MAFNKDRPTNIKYFVGCVTKEEDEDGDVEVSFLRRSAKVARKFLSPDVPDIGIVPKQDIHAVLPSPMGTGTTARTKSGLVFYIDFSHINLC